MKIKLEKQPDDTYTWNDWSITKTGGWYSCKSTAGFVGSAKTLKEVRELLSATAEAIRVDGDMPAGVHKTATLIRKEKATRPEAERLQAADEAICSLLRKTADKAEAVLTDFVDQVNVDNGRSVAHFFGRMGGPAVRAARVLSCCEALLNAEDAEQRKEYIEHHHQECIRRALDTHDGADVGGNFRRATQRELAVAEAETFKLVDECLRIYHEEVVEAPEPISWL